MVSWGDSELYFSYPAYLSLCDQSRTFIGGLAASTFDWVNLGDGSPTNRVITEESQMSKDFDDAMMDVNLRGRNECGYNATRYLQMLHEHRRLETAHLLLSLPMSNGGKQLSSHRNGTPFSPRKSEPLRGTLFGPRNTTPLFSAMMLHFSLPLGRSVDYF
jgi:hypothetical protein